MGEEQTKKLVIVGGGSAGWMTAAFLSKVLGIELGSPYSILLIEATEVPPIGVGEATVHTLRQFLAASGVQEGEFLLAADATFKHGILFRDWISGSSEDRDKDRYFHPFEGYPPLAPEQMVNHWLNVQHRSACADRYDKWAGIQGVLAACGVAPKDWQAKPYEGAVPYGYHLDANKFAHFLKEIAVRRGVKHVLGYIKDAILDDQGCIKFLSLKDGQNIVGDFFIDCSGFASVLMTKLGARFISLADNLYVDRAITSRISNDATAAVPRPYTTATARQNGWTFEIDLISRTGFGYVYSSRHIDDEGAEREFRSFLAPTHKDIPISRIKTRVGRLNEIWIQNCLAIGLSAGFLEPLESTGLYFVELALRLFVDYFDFDNSSPPVKAAFNRTFAHIFDEVAQFIMLHYMLSKRGDTDFWRDARSKSVLLPSLDEKLELWAAKAPTDSDFAGPATPFGPSNYSALLFGMKRLTAEIPALVRHIPVEQSLSHYNRLKEIQSGMVKALPRHADYLKKCTAAFS